MKNIVVKLLHLIFIIERIPKKIRRSVQLALALFIVVFGSLIWSWNYWIQSQTDGLTRYIRVDSWGAFQALFLFAELRTDLFAVDLNEESQLHEVGLSIARARAALELLKSSEVGEPFSYAAAGLPEISPNSDIGQLERAIGAGEQLRAVGLLPGARDDVSDILERLKNASSDLAAVRFELQDQDLTKAQWLIGTNRLVLLCFFGFSSLLGMALIAEAAVARSSERRAISSERRFRDISEVASDSIWETDASGILTFASDRLSTAKEHVLKNHIGRSIVALAGHDIRQAGLRQVMESMNTGSEFRDTVIVVGSQTNNQNEMVLRVSGKPVVDHFGGLTGYRGVATDITDEIRREERIRYLAENDFLTRLPNRQKFHEILKEAYLNLNKNQDVIVITMIDLDGFKEINDTHGHQLGDQLLVRVGDRIRNQIDNHSTLARLGGDEFALIDRIDRAQIDKMIGMVERIVWFLEQSFDIRGQTLKVSASAGVAVFPDDVKQHNGLMQAADLALLAAKQTSETNVVRYTSDMALELRQRRELEKDLRSALDNNELELNFQPQVCLGSGQLIGAEALVRWNHPTLGRVNPELFVSIAEERGMIRSLGRWVLETACAQALQWPCGVVAVNVSPNQFIQDDLVSLVERVLGETGLPANRLELEITEGVLMKSEDEAIAILNQFRSMGIHLAIDDFGTGFSSLSYLKRFPVHKVKIDKSFVLDLDRNEDDQLIVNAIISLGKALGLKVIAEGIELDEHISILQRMGCDEGQGYYFGKPMRQSEFLAMTKNFVLDKSGRAEPAAVKRTANNPLQPA